MTGMDEVLYRLTRLEADLNTERARREKDTEISAVAFAQVRKEIEDTERARLAQERRLFTTGLIFLGSVISTLAWIIWNNLATIMPGRH